MGVLEEHLARVDRKMNSISRVLEDHIKDLEHRVGALEIKGYSYPSYPPTPVDRVHEKDVYWHGSAYHDWGPPIQRRGVTRLHCKVYGCKETRLP